MGMTMMVPTLVKRGDVSRIVTSRKTLKRVSHACDVASVQGKKNEQTEQGDSKRGRDQKMNTDCDGKEKEARYDFFNGAKPRRHARTATRKMWNHWSPLGHSNGSVPVASRMMMKGHIVSSVATPMMPKKRCEFARATGSSGSVTYFLYKTS